MKNISYIIILAFLLGSCSAEKVKFPQADIKTDAVPVTIHRYGKTLFSLDKQNFSEELRKIQKEYGFFLSGDLNDTANISQLYDYVTDTQLFRLYEKTIEVYPELNDLTTSLGEALGRYHYYFPDNKLPAVYTYVSNLYYEMPVWKNDSVMIIALDMYLGKDFEMYKYLGLPYYKVRCLEPGQIVVDVMKRFYLDDVAVNHRPKTLLDQMVAGGKMLAFLDAVLPHMPDSLKICYTESKFDWANKNERNIWAFLIEKELLYSTDYEIQTKLISDGPFTTGFSNDSPSRLGIFIGWKIVDRFLKNNPGISLPGMLVVTDSQELLSRSGYKP